MRNKLMQSHITLIKILFTSNILSIPKINIIGHKGQTLEYGQSK